MMGGPADPIAELVTLLARLPGIGERTGLRLAFFVLGADRQYAAKLGEALVGIHDRVLRCTECGNWGAVSPCSICTSSRRDPTVVCVVSRVPDLIAIERSATFQGHYHVLHALLAPLDGIGPDQLRVESLVERVRKNGVREVIVATPLSVEGEATALYLAQVLRPLSVRLSRIASGIPHGGEVELADQVTLGRAFEGRRDL